MRPVGTLFRRAVLGGMAAAAAVAAAAQGTDPVREALRRRIELADVRPVILAEGEGIHANRALPSFYEARGFAPAWSEGGRPGPQARRLVSFIEQVGDEGLRPDDYHLDGLRALLGEGGPDAAALAEADLLLTDAFLILGAHLVSGRVDPTSFDPEWIAVRREVDLVEVLDRALATGDVRGALLGLRPRHPGYERLLGALARYRALEAAGGWPRVPDGPSLKPGDTDPAIAVVRRRLRATGDLTADPAGAPEGFDDMLDDAVRAFQLRHGLDDDGVIGPATREAMNVGAARRVRQIELNLERWRWLPRDLGERYVLVNIPEFRLRVVEDGVDVLTMKVIVGRAVRRTPVFSDVMRYLVLSPSWEVPPTILRHDKIPEIRRDPDYVRRQNMRVFRQIDGRWREVDPSEVDWAAASASTLRLRQDPGPNNALGRIKFMFPNAFNVYLHDTPSRELFARSQRDFSSGCIRLERPLDLALYLLAGDPRWTREAVVAAMESGREQTVTLSRPIPVHLQHWTAWADAGGVVEFRRDLYGRDVRLDTALRLPPPLEPEEGEPLP